VKGEHNTTRSVAIHAIGDEEHVIHLRERREKEEEEEEERERERGIEGWLGRSKCLCFSTLSVLLSLLLTKQYAQSLCLSPTRLANIDYEGDDYGGW